MQKRGAWYRVNTQGDKMKVVETDNRGITTRTASNVLKGLASRGVLTWRGKSLRDSKQYYEITPKEIS